SIHRWNGQGMARSYSVGTPRFRRIGQAPSALALRSCVPPVITSISPRIDVRKLQALLHLDAEVVKRVSEKRLMTRAAPWNALEGFSASASHPSLRDTSGDGAAGPSSSSTPRGPSTQT